MASATGSREATIRQQLPEIERGSRVLRAEQVENYGNPELPSHQSYRVHVVRSRAQEIRYWLRRNAGGWTP
jgi:hypothetical protein